jgi:hypothetical protein
MISYSHIPVVISVLNELCDGLGVAEISFQHLQPKRLDLWS